MLIPTEKLTAIYALLKPPDADNDMDRYLILYGMLMASNMYRANPILASKLLEPLYTDSVINYMELSQLMQRINQL